MSGQALETLHTLVVALGATVLFTLFVIVLWKFITRNDSREQEEFRDTLRRLREDESEAFSNYHRSKKATQLSDGVSNDES